MKSNNVNVKARNVLFFYSMTSTVLYCLHARRKPSHYVNSEHDLSVGEVFWKATELPLRMVMEICWKRYCVSNGSDVTMVNLLPISCISSISC